MCYIGGLGTPKDLIEAVNEAVKWYKKASEQGDADAKRALKDLGYN